MKKNQYIIATFETWVKQQRNNRAKIIAIIIQHYNKIDSLCFDAILNKLKFVFSEIGLKENNIYLFFIIKYNCRTVFYEYNKLIYKLR